MNTCLVTKLASSVNDNTLSKLGELKVKINSSSSASSLSILNGEDFTIRLSGDLCFSDGETSKDFLSGKWCTDSITLDEGYMYVSNKYSLNGFNEGRAEIDLQDLVYCTKLQQLRLGIGTTGDIKYLSSMTDMIRLNLQETDVTGKVSDISALANLTSLNLYLCSGIECELKDLAVFKKITTFGTNLIGIKLYGSIEDFVHTARTERGTTGSIAISYLGTSGNVTFQNLPVTNVESNTISWTKDTMTYNGTTIDG